MDDLLSQADQDAAAVQEMEQLLGAMPELSGIPSVSDEVGRAMVQTPEELQPFIGNRPRTTTRERTIPPRPRQGERQR